MKIKALITSSVIVSGLLSSIAFSQPTEDYEDTVALLKHEKGIHYKSAWRRTLWPYPIPFVINNVISGTYGWKKYNKANKMYRLYKSSQTIVEYFDQGKEKDKKHQKAYNRVHHALLKLQKESREAAASKNGIIERQESQKQLDQRVQEMTTEDLARLLNEANKTIPPTCGKPEAGVGNFNGHNLRFKIRTVSLYKENVSMLEEEIGLEYEKMSVNADQQEEGYEDLEDLEQNDADQGEVNPDQAPEAEQGKVEPAPDQAPEAEQGKVEPAPDQAPEAEQGKVEPAPDQAPEAEQGKVEPAPDQAPEAEQGKVEPAPDQAPEAEQGKVEPAPDQAPEAEQGKVEPAPDQAPEAEQGKVEPTPGREDSISDSEDTDDFEERLKEVERELANNEVK